MQGDLTDPLYFDFISWAQSATLNGEMPRGKQTFQVPASALHSCSLPACRSCFALQGAAGFTPLIVKPATLHAQEYCEECENTGRLRTVTRSPELESNAALPAALQQTAGNMIYTGMRTGFRVRLRLGARLRLLQSWLHLQLCCDLSGPAALVSHSSGFEVSCFVWLFS